MYQELVCKITEVAKGNFISIDRDDSPQIGDYAMSAISEQIMNLETLTGNNYVSFYDKETKRTKLLALQQCLRG